MLRGLDSSELDNCNELAPALNCGACRASNWGGCHLTADLTPTCNQLNNNHKEGSGIM